MIRVVLPHHLRNLAGVGDEVHLDIGSRATLGAALDALEEKYPALRGTIRDHATLQRRPFVRFFACKEDLSHEGTDAVLPEPVLTGVAPLLIIGAMAGG
jgi:hypothetical protein